MLQFWISWLCIFLTTSLCSVVNANIYRSITVMIPWLKTTFKPILLEAGKPTEARDITLNVIPELDKWLWSATWYGSMTFVLQLLLFLIAGLVTFWSHLPYILLLVSVMLLGTTLYFFPRTLIRRAKLQSAVLNYDIAYMLLLIKVKADEGENLNGGTYDSRTNPHG